MYQKRLIIYQGFKSVGYVMFLAIGFLAWIVAMFFVRDAYDVLFFVPLLPAGYQGAVSTLLTVLLTSSIAGIPYVLVSSLIEMDERALTHGTQHRWSWFVYRVLSGRLFWLAALQGMVMVASAGANTLHHAIFQAVPEIHVAWYISLGMWLGVFYLVTSIEAVILFMIMDIDNNLHDLYDQG